MVTIDDVREFVSQLPRSYEALVRDQVKFRVGRIVYLAFSRDETIMGFGFPKEEREALVASDPVKFLMPVKSDLRYNWVRARLDALELDETRELVLDAWMMCVPKSVAADYLHNAPGTKTLRQALARNPTLDITTTGRRSGQPRRLEIWMLDVNGRFFITGTSGRRDWLANLIADPHLVVHVDGLDLAARATVVAGDQTRRQVFEDPSASWYVSQEPLDVLVMNAPMVEVVLTPT